MKAWREIKRKEIFSKYGRALEEVIFDVPGHGEMDFVIKKERPSVCMLALTKDMKVILCRQFRPGPNMIMDELPGGYVDPGEETNEAAVRELIEETGYTGKVKKIGECYDDAYSTMVRHCYVVTDCHKVSDQELEPGNEIELIEMELTQFRELLRSGKMTDVEVGYLGLDYLSLLG